MSLYYANGSPKTDLPLDEMRAALFDALRGLEPRGKVLALPPDHTRANSMSGPLCRLAYDYFGDRLSDVMPTLGTHVPMTDRQLQRMFPGMPPRLFRVHDWRRDVVTVGTVPAEFVAEATEGVYRKPWPAQLNRLIWEGGHDLILSIGQIVPHEVVGMAGYNKNLFVGAGGQEGINESHFIGAAYGMERMMGRADTPLRRILNYAQENFCSRLPVVFVLTVVGPRDNGTLAMRGLFIGDDAECFHRAAALSLQVNFTVLDEPPRKIVAFLDGEEFHTTWLGNKAIYRTRMAIADGGELVVLAPGVGGFGEDPEIDRLIRKYGYRTTPEIMQFVEQEDDLRQNLSAAAHLIHGSPENRFTVTYCPGKLTREEILSVGYNFAELGPMLQRYDPKTLRDGWNELPDGERVYFIGNPALGLWAARQRMERKSSFNPEPTATED
ncbi:MAG: D-mannonate epimerase [Pirellulales bacterium]|nr:D-mannonate epimerase [Pirellulales bacterium]